MHLYPIVLLNELLGTIVLQKLFVLHNPLDKPLHREVVCQLSSELIRAWAFIELFQEVCD